LSCPRSALFIVVRTIVARLEGGGFQVQPFLVTGIISATRDILTVGAELSLTGAQTPAGSHHDGTGGSTRAWCSRWSWCGAWPGWIAPDRDVSATILAPGGRGWPELAALRMCWRWAETSVEL
jgi:hypothetical protein